MEERKIFNDCLDQLKQLTPVTSVHVLKQVSQREMDYDARIKITAKKHTDSYNVIVKSVLKRPLASILQHQKRKNENVLLFSKYVNTSIAEDLKKNGLQFIDTQGNVFLNIKNQVYIDIQGKKGAPIKEKISSLYQPKGLQLLFILLSQPDTLNKPLRTIKDLADISYGQTQAGMKELKRKGLIYKDKNDKRHWTNKKELLEKWVTHYGDRLRPKLVRSTYKIMPSLFDKVPDILTETIPEPKWALGGSFGADILDPYYRGLHISLFVHTDIVEEIRKQLKMIPAQETNITLFNMFSDELIYKGKKKAPFVTHPLLLYAELLQQGAFGSRAEETAQRIYQKYLKQDFNERNT